MVTNAFKVTGVWPLDPSVIRTERIHDAKAIQETHEKNTRWPLVMDGSPMGKVLQNARMRAREDPFNEELQAEYEALVAMKAELEAKEAHRVFQMDELARTRAALVEASTSRKRQEPKRSIVRLSQGSSETLPGLTEAEAAIPPKKKRKMSSKAKGKQKEVISPESDKENDPFDSDSDSPSNFDIRRLPFQALSSLFNR